MDIPRLYEDAHIVAINKPAGLLVHRSHASGDEPTVVDWFLANYPAATSVGEPQTLADGSYIARPGVVHRLDKDTSGVLLLAKTAEGYSALKEQFLSHTIQKTYYALTYGVPQIISFTIDRPLRKHSRDFRRFTSRAGRGEPREARTAVIVRERFKQHALLEVSPQTGRTHQIRVHLADEGFPVLCDALYAHGRPCAGGMSRQALHAARVICTPPGVDTPIAIEAPLPEDMVRAIAELRAS